MRRKLLTALCFMMAALFAGSQTAHSQDDSGPGEIVLIFSVGGVLTADGTLWQYSPSNKWQTIDEAFAHEGRETHIMPLPVSANQIEEMVTFGFIRTKSNVCWLYDLESDEWMKLPPPS